MRINIINYLVCPICQGSFLLLIHKEIKERIIDGELKCKKCSKKFYIKDGIACFTHCLKNQFKKNAQDLRKITIEQEIPKKWMRLFSRQELVALKKEWNFLLSVIKKDKSVIHLDFATGTGRFIRNIVSRTKGEIIALERDYSTCIELQYFLEKIKKYNHVSIVCADARKMPFKDYIFDSITSWHGLDELKMEKAIRESKRVLKKGGLLTVSGVHYQKGSMSFLRAKKHGIRFIAKEAIVRFLKENNFRKVEHKVFFMGRWDEKESYLPKFGDFYSSFAVKAKK